MTQPYVALARSATARVGFALQPATRATGLSIRLDDLPQPLRSPASSKALASHSTAWNDSIGEFPCALACGTPGIPLTSPPAASPSPTTMASISHLPVASYTAVGFTTPGGALSAAGEPSSSSFSGRGSAAPTAVDASPVARLGEPSRGALGGVRGTSPRGDETREVAARDAADRDEEERGDNV